MLGAAVAAGSVVSAAPSSAAAPSAVTATVAYYPMNEAAGARTIVAQGGSGPNGYIGTEVVTGTSYSGAKGYTFAKLPPNQPPAHPEHLVTIPDDPRLDPDSATFSIEIRYRTTNRFGNLIQKGQSQTAGGQIKIQLPKGEPQCNYKGADGGVSVRWHQALNDGQWHTLKCTRTSTGVELWADGVLRVSRKGATGTLNNSFPISIAGKPKCDQVKVTCDYFGGQVDWVRITKG